MKQIEYLPKFHERADVDARQKELNECKKELLASGKLSESEIEMINDFELTYRMDSYSKNHVIRKINELMKFVECR